ncbi:hypothetical protein [Streptomyces sp. BA2]|uniref:hypothetical protein n=1 Tax=Streptomyces sp. BA2 TaxID=436595 RepID=UPI00132B5119|nr:hypothetical protein [Streptomyces sp. BA2]MWA12571.1 hypothetical protein [Streptomyces sp. BA2]
MRIRTVITALAMTAVAALVGAAPASADDGPAFTAINQGNSNVAVNFSELW